MLLDSNIIIYASQPENTQIRQFIGEHDIVVSAISYIEVLGYHRLTEEIDCTLKNSLVWWRFYQFLTLYSIAQCCCDR
jgi:hypothetical protein